MAIENRSLVLFATGTQVKYDELTKSDNTLYFTSDTHKLYLGEDCISGNVVDVEFVNDTTIKITYKDNTTKSINLANYFATKVHSHPYVTSLDGVVGDIDLIVGSNMTITPNTTNKTITLASSYINNYVSGVSWSGGTTAGPVLNLTRSGLSALTATIPSASTLASGIVTTGTQSFAGIKTFDDFVNFNDGLSVGGSSSWGPYLQRSVTEGDAILGRHEDNTVKNYIRLGSNKFKYNNGTTEYDIYHSGNLNWSSLLSKPTTFTPPVATSSVRGGVKVGSSLSISSEILNVASAPKLSVPNTGSLTIPTYFANGVPVACDLSDNYVPLTGGTLTGSLTIKTVDTATSELNLIGNDQGSGRLYVGQNATYGGGIEYNGDGTPVLSGAPADTIALYRRSGGTNTVTAYNSHSSNDWTYKGYLTATGFKKTSSSDSYVLLGGGGHKALSGFSLPGHTHNYEPAFSKNSAFNKSFGTDVGTVCEGSNYQALKDKVDDIEAFFGEDTDNVVNKFNEIVEFLDATEDTTLDSLIDTRAPKSHASTATTYGIGTSANNGLYGHVKFSTTAPSMNGTASAGTTTTGIAAAYNHVHPVDTTRAAAVHSHDYVKSLNDMTGDLEIEAGNGNITITKDTTGKKIKISSTDTNTTYNPVTTTANGLMTAADKVKLNGISTEANKYVLPIATADILGGVKVGTGLSKTTDGKISVDTSGLSISGNAATATTATNATKVNVATSATSASYPLVFVSDSAATPTSGSKALAMDSVKSLYYNPSSNELYATTFKGNLDWSYIQGKPSTYAPSAHSQSWSTITSKPATYAPSAHNQSWSTITDKPAIVTGIKKNGEASSASGVVEFKQAGATTISREGNVITISSTDTNTNTTYSAGTGLNLTGTSFSTNFGNVAGTVCQGNDSRLTWSGLPGKPASFTPISHASTATTYGIGTSANYGHVKLSDSTSSASSASSGVAATPKAVSDAISKSPYIYSTSYSMTGTSSSQINKVEITTAEFVTTLKNAGMFTRGYNVCKCSWSYAGQCKITDTGIGVIATAGAIIEVFCDPGNSTVGYTIRITTPNATSGGTTHTEYIYNNQGPEYSPGWRKIWSSGSDGSGSGLDADLLDGKHASSFALSSHSHSYLPLTGGTLTGSLTIKTVDTATSELNLIGNDQGSGRLYVGQNATYGGGIEYNGDGTPVLSGAPADTIALYRRSGGTNTVTAYNSHSSNDWTYKGYLTATGFKKTSSSDSYVLLGGGGHKALSGFSLPGHTHNYEPAFSKNSAFNKSFGTDVGTVCEGSNYQALKDKVDDIEAFFGEDTDNVVNKFNEIVEFLDATEDTTLDSLIDTRAPKSHASTATTYGIGTSANNGLYGHVKFSTTAPSMNGTASAGTTTTGIAAAYNHVHPVDTTRAAAVHSHDYVKSLNDMTGDLEIEAGNGNITITKDTTGKKIKISSTDTNTTYNPVTTTANGLMTAADKVKLNGISTEANKYVLPIATADILGGVKVGTGLSKTTDGKISVDTSGLSISGNAATATTATNATKVNVATSATSASYPLVFVSDSAATPTSGSKALAMDSVKSLYYNPSSNELYATTFKGNLDWSYIQGKPSTYAPSAHSQSWSTITSKPATYAPSAHNQSWSTITDKPAIVTGIKKNGEASSASGVVEFKQAGATTISREGNVITISSTDTNTNTTYSAGTGLNLTGTSFSTNFGNVAGTVCQGNDSRLTWSGLPGKPASFTPISHASTATTYGIGTSANYGHVKLSDSTSSASSASSGVAATPKAVSDAISKSPYIYSTSYSMTGTSSSQINKVEITTAEFVTTLKNAGMFTRGYNVCKCSWSYAGQCKITDTGIGVIATAGAIIEVFCDPGNSTVGYTIRITTPNATSGGTTHTEYIYNNQGPEYSPGWRKIWSSGSDGSGSGLDADLLDGKHASSFALSSHSHSYLPLTGGSLTGNLNIIAGSTDKYINFRNDATDKFAWRLGYKGSGAGNDNRLVIDTGLETGVWSNALNIGLNDKIVNFAVTPIAPGFKKTSSSDSYVLLGGGGHKALSDFSLSTYSLPTASTTVKGGVKVGEGLKMIGEAITTASTQFNSTTATATVTSTPATLSVRTTTVTSSGTNITHTFDGIATVACYEGGEQIFCGVKLNTNKTVTITWDDSASHTVSVVITGWNIKK